MWMITTMLTVLTGTCHAFFEEYTHNRRLIFNLASEYGRNYILYDGILKTMNPGTCRKEVLEESGDLPGLSFWIYHD
jgi:hypothetical protein